MFFSVSFYVCIFVLVVVYFFVLLNNCNVKLVCYGFKLVNDLYEVVVEFFYLM